MNQNELMHYGVLGMKWGRRKNPNYGSSKDSKRARNILKSKKVDQMSNEELKVVNKRLELEREHKRLTTRKSVGKKAVQTFIGVAGTIVAAEAAAKTYERIGKAAIEKIAKKAI